MTHDNKVVALRRPGTPPARKLSEAEFFAQTMAKEFPDETEPKEGQYIGGHDWDWKQK